MAVTLAQAAALIPDPVARGVVELFIKESNVLDRLPLEPVTGNAWSYNQEEALPGTAFRTVNEAYVESTGVINQVVEKLKILGGDADVDRFVQTTMGGTLGDHLAQQTNLKVRSTQATFSEALFTGDTLLEPKGFDGLRKRLVRDQVIDATGDLTPGTVEEAHAQLDQLDALCAAVSGGPDVIYGNKSVVAKLKGLFRRSGGFEQVRNDITGKTELTWNGVPVVDPGNTFDGRPVLPVDPTNGTDLYALRFASGPGEVGVMGITNGNVQTTQLGELQDKPAHRVRIEFYAGLVVQGGQAAARLRGVKLN
ncbi:MULTISPECIES: major capsid protein [unclassified Crossiella]|uniref:major capsid protein n=1 Tax=unclassified Crossiella TaxID=2620835 RepID=UPI001FFE84C0|nr:MULTISPECIES: hypothetical protein [unclassified Crossiella]MCK2242326.1 hypothetical protein [Crossiella sp. S99.2]MCK2254643.1 hypothetical protein [Crossiella sp. S99.1]